MNAESKFTASKQNGEPGSCFLAQVFGPSGEAIAQFEPTSPPGTASRYAELLAAALNGNPSASALDKLGDAIVLALDECPVHDVLSVLTGSFVGLAVELVRRAGEDTQKAIVLKGGPERRSITIHKITGDGVR